MTWFDEGVPPFATAKKSVGFCRTSDELRV